MKAKKRAVVKVAELNHPVTPLLPNQLAAKIPEGFVYIGRGHEIKTPANGIPSNDFVYMAEGDHWKEHFTSLGNNPSSFCVFAARIGSETYKLNFTEGAAPKFVVEKPLVSTKAALGTQIKLANSLEDKLFRLRGGKDTYPFETSGVYTHGLKSANIQQNILDVKTPNTFVYVVDSNGYQYPIFDIVEIVRPPVKINGYNSIDQGDIVNFGCANIDKNLLVAAKKFFEEAAGVENKGNRKVESVKIGTGSFTLKDIENLL